MKSFYLGLFLCLVALLTACGHKQVVVKNEKSNAIKVKTETVLVTDGIVGFRYSGTVEPSQTIPLSFQSTGTVDNVFVHEGDVVHKGQLLATVDKEDNESISRASIAKYKQAKDAYDRLKSVYDKGSLPEIKWVEMETNLAQAEEQMHLTQSNLEKCNLRAPENGVIGKRDVEPGQSAISLIAPIELVKIETVLVKISVPENEISKIKKGLKASFSISALDGKIFEGTVSSVGVIADKISRTYEVKISAKNPNLIIKPGMVCDVNLCSNAEKKILLVSKDAVTVDNGDKTYVYIVSTDKKSVKKQYIKLGNYQDSGIEVIEGLKPEQIVVVAGKEKLSDNSIISL